VRSGRRLEREDSLGRESVVEVSCWRMGEGTLAVAVVVGAVEMDVFGFG
jgi:hypothetical protein